MLDESFRMDLSRVEVDHRVLDDVVVLVLNQDGLVHHLLHVVEAFLLASGTLAEIVSVAVLDLRVVSAMPVERKRLVQL